MNNKEAMELLGIDSAEELNKIHREHVNDPKGWVSKVQVDNSDNGYYKRSEWQFTQEYFHSVLVPKYKPQNIKPGTEQSTEGSTVFLKDMDGTFRVGIRIKSVKPEDTADGRFVFLYEDINTKEKFWSYEEK